jgi:serine/threonine-protein kinase
LTDQRQLERFRREARAVGRLHHPNIVPVFGVGEQEGTHFYAMEFIPGQSLDRVLQDVGRLRADGTAGGESDPPLTPGSDIARGLRTGAFTGPRRQAAPAAVPASPVPTAESAPNRESGEAGSPGAGSTSGLAQLTEIQYFRSVARVGVQVAEALDYAHRQGVLHRDIKPSNLLLDAQGTAWVTDFGLAKADGADDLTQIGEIVGTLRYMAPERFSGWSDTRSDVYGLGVTLYEMLTLRPAFADTDRVRLMECVTREEPPRPRRLDPRIPRDLETIVCKAMAKEPAERYRTAGELSEDLRLFLGDRPIRARRSSGPERSWRWCRRNPAVAVLLATLALALTGGLLGVTWQWRRAEHHLAEAQDNLHLARATEYEARRTVDEYFTRVSESALLDVPGLQPLRQELLEDALRYYQSFLERQGADPSLRAELAVTCFRLASIHHMVGQRDQSISAIQKGLEFLTPLLDGQAGSGGLQRRLAGFWKGFRILNYHRPVLPRDLHGALRTLRQASALWEQFARENPDVIGFRADLAAMYLQTSLFLSDLGEMDEAIGLNEKARALWEQLVREYPNTHEYRADLSEGYHFLGVILYYPPRAQARRPREAEQAFRKAVALQEQLVAEFPTSPFFRQFLAVNYANLARLLQQTGRLTEAEQTNRKAIGLLEKLAADFPGVYYYREQQAMLWDDLCALLAGSGRPREADQARRQSIGIREKAVTDFPTDPGARSSRGHLYRLDAFARHHAGQTQEALQLLHKALQVFAELTRDFPDVPGNWHFLADTHRRIGVYLAHQKQAREAEQSYRRALSVLEKLPLKSAQAPVDWLRYWKGLNSGNRGEVMEAYANLGSLLEGTGRPQEAEGVYRRAVEFYEKLAAELPYDTDSRQHLIQSYELLSKLYAGPLSRPQEGEEARRRAHAIREQLRPAGRAAVVSHR